MRSSHCLYLVRIESKADFLSHFRLLVIGITKIGRLDRIDWNHVPDPLEYAGNSGIDLYIKVCEAFNGMRDLP